MAEFSMKELNSLIASKNIDAIKEYMKEHNLKLDNGKIVPVDKAEFKAKNVFWDQRQQARKLMLNSLYGAILNSASLFYDQRVGQSVTLSGRSIVKHMNSVINQCITGEYSIDGKGIVYIDTDSVAGDTLIDTDSGFITIEELFEKGQTKHLDLYSSKEYSFNNELKVRSFNPKTNDISYKNFKYVYRHKVSKSRYRITSSNDNFVDVTSDHSVMVYINNILKEVKPKDLKIGDTLVSYDDNFIIAEVKSIEQLEDFDNEYVYDIGIDNDTPYFFGNKILVHNSCYFSIENMVDKFPDRDTIVSLYDNIAESANDSFPEFMNKTFNTGIENGGIIKAGRELIGSRGLFIKKKKYAILYYDKDGIRYDKDGKPGKLKAMGLDLKRADTPKVMQDFLEEVLMDLLTDHTKEEIFAKIRAFRTKFHGINSWEKGTPKKVNSISEYQDKLLANSVELNSDISKMRQSTSNKKVAVPGHVTASINWNNMLNIHNDRFSTPITDGTKIIVCKLKQNDYKIKSIAYPVDQFILPEWFKTLPFDDEEMEETIIDKKLFNLFGVLNWNFQDTKVDTTFNDLFDF